MPIRQLPPDVVNKIAAGEVIERPASVVKELMENAVDAQATRIEVSLEKGGTHSICVTDNGHGIEQEQLPLAVASHATSKLTDANDLFRVATLGFRGEALASIAAVSRMTLRSRTADSNAFELIVNGGQLQPVAPAGAPQGTSVRVEDLLFNTPVRRKFLRTVPTELGHCTEAFNRIALAHPNVHAVLTHNGRIVHELTPTDHWPDRIASLYGSEISESLIDVESEKDSVRLTGYVANPSQSRANTRMQYLLLNGRAIRDRSLQHALTEAYRGLLLTGRYPICFLRLEMPPELVDVNVHPTKMEVRFQNGGELYSQLLGMMRTRFLTADLTARGQAGHNTDRNDAGDNVEQQASALVAWAQQELSQQQRELDGSPNLPARPESSESTTTSLSPMELVPIGPAATTSSPPEQGRGVTRGIREFRPFGESFTAAVADSSTQQLPNPQSAHARDDMVESHVATAVQSVTRALQIHNRYLITESEQGVEVIDQHALHERILYEQLRDRVLKGPLESQRLLVPEPVDLSPSEAAAVRDNLELLATLGMQVEPFGGDTVLIASYPAMLANMSQVDVLRGLVEHFIQEKTPDRRDLLESLLHSIACKAAVKYGDRLSGEEIDALIAQRHLAQDHHHCPHGRPTSLIFTKEDLDRQFKRI